MHKQTLNKTIALSANSPYTNTIAHTSHIIIAKGDSAASATITSILKIKNA